MGGLHTIAWVLCCIYATIPGFWLLIHPFAERWRTHRGPKYKLLFPLWIAMWVVMGIVTSPGRDVLLYRTPLAWIAAGGLFALGIFLYVSASRGFSANQLGGRPELEAASPQQFVRGGIRERVRHPIYLAHLCEMLAWSVGTGMVVLFALTGFAVLTGAIMIRQEEAELARRFGIEWERYRERVPAILPRV
jgi:protein-S-isoprenylcysteine O-methyltransferase Ste14